MRVLVAAGASGLSLRGSLPLDGVAAIAMPAELQRFGASPGVRQALDPATRRPRKRAEWAKPGERALHRAVTDGECAARLRALVAADPVIVEAMVMDQRGALVCASVGTSDYWQGDEAKWLKSFGAGTLHIEEAERDESTQLMQSQASLPIRDPRTGTVIGAITVGVNLDAL